MKNKLALFLTVFAAVSLIFYGCEEIFKPITISGRVVDQNTLIAVSNATVSIISPADIAAETISDENGDFLFEDVPVDSVINVTIRAEKEGYANETITLLAAPKHELIVPDLKIRNLQTNTNGDIDSPIGGAASIVLVNLTSPVINITETGGAVNSSFTFEVQDSSGRAIDADHAIDVEFQIVEGPDGGESITPTVVQTDANGLASSNIFAGNKAGNVKIEAKIERPEYGLTIRSKPILLAIHGGFPDLDHFSIAASVYNFEAYSINGNRDAITVIVGDKYSNPVKPQTPVYFNSTGGVIQGSGVTNSDGEVTVNLISGDPRPSDQYATVRAHTFDENDNRITRSIIVLFSGPPASNKINVSPSTINIPANGGQKFTFSVTDINDNPLPYNTRIRVMPAEGMSVSGDISITVPNALYPGPGVTQFAFTAQDSDEENSDPKEVSIFIDVETPGGYRASKSISGTKSKAAF